MAELEPLVYGKVVGRFLANIADGADINDKPEFAPLSGTVTFTAEAPKVLVADAVPDPATYVQLPKHYACSLDENGYITWRGKRGVLLVAPNEDTNPTAWTWRVSFALEFEGDPVPMASYNFEVPEYIPGPDEENPDEDSVGLVDLALVSPVPASNGEAVVRGLSVVDVDRVGTALVFRLDNGETLDPVALPEIQDVVDAKDDAVQAKNDAVQAKNDAEDLVNSFDLVVGSVTTGDPGDSAEVTVTGPGPVWTVDVTLPKGDTGPPGPPAPDADATTKGIVQLAGDLGGTAAAPTVPGLTGKVGTDRTISTTAPLTGGGDLSADRTLAVSDASTGSKGVVQLAGILAGTAASPAFNAAAFGTSSSTACVGNDTRLSNARTPATGTVPYDMSITAFGKGTTRATGTGDFPFGVKLARAVTFTSVTYRGNTNGASGSLIVELRKNGSAVSGSSATITGTAAATGGTATGTWAFALGDVLTVYVTTADGTPGTGLHADITGLA